MCYRSWPTCVQSELLEPYPWWRGCFPCSQPQTEGNLSSKPPPISHQGRQPLVLTEHEIGRCGESAPTTRLGARLNAHPSDFIILQHWHDLCEMPSGETQAWGSLVRQENYSRLAHQPLITRGPRFPRRHSLARLKIRYQASSV